MKKMKFYTMASNRKPVVQLTLEGKIVKMFDYLNQVEMKGFSASGVGYCCRGTTNTYKGYIWMFTKDYDMEVAI